MSYLLFMDESGHDHHTCPYEVRGGLAIEAGNLWSFVQGMMAAEQAAFGDSLAKYGKEIKGHRLLDKDRFKWAEQDGPLEDAVRRKHVLSFLNKGRDPRGRPTRVEFTAYGQACLLLAREIFRLLRDQGAKVFAAAIPLDAPKSSPLRAPDFLRKDYVFLLERYFYFLEAQKQHGLLVLDETEKPLDRELVRRLLGYFTLTTTGRYRTAWVVPTPFFVASDMAYPVQAADVCIYCVNWGFRLPKRGMDGPAREEIGREFGPWLAALQWESKVERDGKEFHSYSIVYVPDPYQPREPTDA